MAVLGAGAEAGAAGRGSEAANQRWWLKLEVWEFDRGWSAAAESGEQCTGGRELGVPVGSAWGDPGELDGDICGVLRREPGEMLGDLEAQKNF